MKKIVRKYFGPKTFDPKKYVFMGEQTNLGRGGHVGEVEAEVQKGVEHGSIAPRKKWPGPFLAEGFGPSLPHLSQFL